MSDADAYMALALNNAQGELHPLEEGMHAIGSGLDQKAYAEKVGKARTNIQHRWYAAEVAGAVPNIGHDIRDHWLAVGIACLSALALALSRLPPRIGSSRPAARS